MPEALVGLARTSEVTLRREYIWRTWIFPPLDEVDRDSPICILAEGLRKSLGSLKKGNIYRSVKRARPRILRSLRAALKTPSASLLKVIIDQSTMT
jgi:hypothetical protein